VVLTSWPLNRRLSQQWSTTEFSAGRDAGVRLRNLLDEFEGGNAMRMRAEDEDLNIGLRWSHKGASIFFDAEEGFAQIINLAIGVSALQCQNVIAAGKLVGWHCEDEAGAGLCASGFDTSLAKHFYAPDRLQ